MKRSIFLTSFFSTQRSGSKPLTSPAMRVAKPAVSKRVIGPMPERPASSASQVGAVPTPSGDTSPTPVTTTRRRSLLAMLSRMPRPPAGGGPGSVLLGGVLLDVGDGLGDLADLLGVLVRNLDAELFLERHHQLDDVERVGAEVVRE